ncbi:uncharacterized protein LOC101461673 [Ceratitis capitata]|uniref:uncharacterized protein LOC101461673 n=1 Tax=Ceratitis capitata TaxID=7213 RepID=UPI000329D208|nr:uncharacterized protein LOC101461673 [Ceratitis capitata]
MLKMSASRLDSCVSQDQSQNVVNEESHSNNNHSSIPLGNGIEETNMDKHHSSRRYDRRDAGPYCNMSAETSDDSLCGTMTTSRKSRRMQPADGYECVNGGLGDCSQCRKHRMAKARRSRRRKSRSRSRRRRRH